MQAQVMMAGLMMVGLVVVTRTSFSNQWRWVHVNVHRSGSSTGSEPELGNGTRVREPDKMI